MKSITITYADTKQKLLKVTKDKDGGYTFETLAGMAPLDCVITLNSGERVKIPARQK
jgi:hypothetical protein